MQKIIISGCGGHMGRVVAGLCAEDPELEVAAGLDILGQPSESFPVFSTTFNLQPEDSAQPEVCILTKNRTLLS